MRKLLIDEEARKRIKKVIDYAQKHPIRTNILASGFIVGNTASYVCELYDSFRVVFSFEEQPSGWCRHLSVSIPDKTKLPNVPAVGMIMTAFDMSKNDNIHDASNIWIDKDSTPMSVNVIQLIDNKDLIKELMCGKS